MKKQCLTCGETDNITDSILIKPRCYNEKNKKTKNFVGITAAQNSDVESLL